jgi:uroporphyrinogen decarboxylase
MTKRERVLAALAGRAVDRVPVSAWAHLIPDERTVDGLASAEVKWLNTYDWDWLKVNPRATVFAEGFGAQFDLETYYGVLPRFTGPTRPFTLDDLKPGDPSKGTWGEHMTLLARLRGSLGDTPFVQTVFSPASILGFLAARPTATTQLTIADAHNAAFFELIRHRPRLAHQALEFITTGLEKLAKASLEAGADGLFFAITRIAREGLLTPAEFDEFCKPYDQRVLKAAEEASFNVLHLCGPKAYWNRAIDYPVHAINWASVGQGNHDVAQARATTDLALIGGIDEGTLLNQGTVQEVESAVQSALRLGGSRKFLLAPGCTVENAKPENLKALRRAVEH